MKWLIITNDNNSDSQNKLAECLCSFDKKNKLSFCDFTCENINKIVKKCDNFASCFIISKNDSNVSEETVRLFCTLLGYFEAKNITVFSNINSLNDADLQIVDLFHYTKSKKITFLLITTKLIRKSVSIRKCCQVHDGRHKFSKI